MTRIDLQLEYRFDTGEYPESDADYAIWLEEQLLYIRNRFDIIDPEIINAFKQLDARMEKIKKARDAVYKEKFGI